MRLSVQKVIESAPLPAHFGSGPWAPGLSALVVAMREALAANARRNNETAPKDGSELQQMTSYDSVDYAMSGNVNNADFGYYTVVRCTLTSGDYDLTGIANGAGQDAVGGRLLRIINTSTEDRTINVIHGSASSTDINRILLPSTPYAVARNETVQLWYDIAALRWRLAA
jgi:hypothetical protein